MKPNTFILFLAFIDFGEQRQEHSRRARAVTARTNELEQLGVRRALVLLEPRLKSEVLVERLDERDARFVVLPVVVFEELSLRIVAHGQRLDNKPAALIVLNVGTHLP